MSDNILIKSGTWRKMIFLSKKYLKIWVAILFILLCSAVYGGYRYYHNKIHNKLLNKADSYMKKDEYKKSEEKLNETSKAHIKDKKEDNADKNSDYSNSGIDTITEEKAVELTSKYYRTKNENTKFVFDHEDIKNNEIYYVIQVFDNMEDHSATMGWYYVNKKSGKIYEWDLGEDKLIPVN